MRKKWMTLLCAVCLASAALWGGGVLASESQPTAVSFRDAFSGVQGKNGWYYLYGDLETGAFPMRWLNVDRDGAAANYWQGPGWGMRSDANAVCSWINADGIRMWQAAADGALSITGNGAATGADAAWDGFRVEIVRRPAGKADASGDETLFAANVSNMGEHTVLSPSGITGAKIMSFGDVPSLQNIPVKRGDKIYYVVSTDKYFMQSEGHTAANSWGDNYDFNVTHTFAKTGEGSAEGIALGFSLPTNDDFILPEGTPDAGEKLYEASYTAEQGANGYTYRTIDRRDYYSGKRQDMVNMPANAAWFSQWGSENNGGDYVGIWRNSREIAPNEDIKTDVAVEWTSGYHGRIYITGYYQDVSSAFDATHDGTRLRILLNGQPLDSYAAADCREAAADLSLNTRLQGLEVNVNDVISFVIDGGSLPYNDLARFCPNVIFVYEEEGEEIPHPWRMDIEQFTRSFSLEQGKNNFYYLAGSMESYTLLKADGESWKGGENQYISPNLYLDPIADSGTILMWRSPADGDLRLLLKEINRCEGTKEQGSDGVHFAVYLKRYDAAQGGYRQPELLFERDADSQRYGEEICSVTPLAVKNGDMIFFAVDKGRGTDANNWFDHYQVLPYMDLRVTSPGTPPAVGIGAEPDYTEYFSATQGGNGWYYLCGKLDGDYYRMTYRDSAKQYECPEQYNAISAAFMTPGNVLDAIRMFVAEDSGRVRVSGYVKKADQDASNKGDGVAVTVTRVGSDPIYSAKIAGNDHAKKPIDAVIEVAKGDRIAVAVGCGDNYDNAWDTVEVMLAVQYVANAGDGDGSASSGDLGELTELPRHPFYITLEEYQGFYHSSQGAGNWYYAYGDPAGDYYAMEYDGYLNKWVNPTPDAFTMLDKSGMHPGNGESAIAVYRAPASGKVKIMGFANKHNAEGDGAIAGIYRNGEPLKEMELAGIARTYFIIETELARGDLLQFSVGNLPGKNIDFDMTDYKFVVDYTQKDDDEAEFTDGEFGQVVLNGEPPQGNFGYDHVVGAKTVDPRTGAKAACIAAGCAGILLAGALIALVLIRRRKRHADKA